MTSTGRKITYATEKYLGHFFYLSRNDCVTATTHISFAREKTFMDTFNNSVVEGKFPILIKVQSKSAQVKGFKAQQLLRI